MNRKHLACLFIALAAVVVVQGALLIGRQLTAMKARVAAAEMEAFGFQTRLNAERQLLVALRQSSAGLIDYLEKWDDNLRAIDSAAAGELNLGARIKGSGLVSLAQRYELVTNGTNTTIPKLVRAYLTFEDDYARTLNWLGDVEAKLPASRVASLKLQRGQSGNDIRMDVVIDLPLVEAGEAK